MGLIGETGSRKKLISWREVLVLMVRSLLPEGSPNPNSPRGVQVLEEGQMIPRGRDTP